MKKSLHIIKALASSIIWGSGQLLNRQYIKALMFFMFMVALVGVELATSSYFDEPFNLYEEKISGEYLGSQALRNAAASLDSGIPAVLAANIIPGTPVNDQAWNDLIASKGESLTFDDIIAFTGQRIRAVHDAHADDVRAAALIVAADRADAYATAQADLHLEAQGLTKDDDPAAWQREYDRLYPARRTREYNTVYRQLYANQMLEDDFLFALKGYFNHAANFNLSFANISTDDWNETLLRIYYAAFPEQFELVYDEFNNFYYERAGFFIKGIWSVITLGEAPLRVLSGNTQIGFLMPAGRTTIEYRVDGHHSTHLMLRGLISTLTLAYFLFVYVWNIKDAYRTSKGKATGKVQSERQYFKELYHNAFEYIVLLPALIIVTFVMVMPILFSLLIAFTNFDTNHIPPGQLVNWVGFRNFGAVFSFTGGSVGGINFGGAFWKIFSWTLIWAVGATFTCFFGGFIQAVFLNNRRVVFKRIWRAVLILPWAVPALVSQLMFQMIFHGSGIVNTFMENAGINNFLRSIGSLGKPMSQVINSTFMERAIYLGNDSVNWLGNEVNPWAVRIFIILLNIWLGFPFFMALMTGVMTSISRDLYEAAEIDGATPYQQFKFITMPLVLYATSPLLIMSFAMNFNNFGVIYFITGGGPGGGDPSRAYAGYTDILISWIYTLTTDDTIRWYSMASVFSILIFLIIGSISAWNFLRTKAFKEEDLI